MNEDIQWFIEKLFDSSPLNHLPENFGGGRIFAKPLTGVARGDDPIFLKFKTVVGPKHATPEEMWIQSGLPKRKDPPSQLRILSIIFPYVDKIRNAHNHEHVSPSDVYCVGRNFAEAFMSYVLDEMVCYFKKRDFHAVAGIKSPIFRILTHNEPPFIYSVWSERHIAFAAGLGTFSLHEGLITEVGCNIRIASVITNAPLTVTPRKSDEPYANCLYYTEGKCQQCSKRCPAHAITGKGHDKIACSLYLNSIEENARKQLGNILKPLKRIVDGQERVDYPTGCALCQFDVPCMGRNPMAAARKN